MYINTKAVADGPVGQVLAGPLFFKVKQNSILQKTSNKTKVLGWFLNLFSLLYYDTADRIRI